MRQGHLLELIVAFLSYRIGITAHTPTVLEVYVVLPCKMVSLSPVEFHSRSVFPPQTTHEQAMNSLNRTLRWILVIPFLLVLQACGGEAEPEAESPPATPMTESTEEATASVAATRFNINTATQEELLTIPGVGDRMLHEFEEYRPYVSIQQFRREIGKYVDEEQVAAYEEYIYVPVRPNESDAETLQQLPGVDAEEAQELIAGRSYATPEAFMEKLASYVSEEELTAVRMYLWMESEG